MTWRDALTDRQRTEVEFAQVYTGKFNHGTAEHDRLTLISELAGLLDAGNIKPATDYFVLDVPYHNQWELDAQTYRKDCGPACVEMVGKFYRPTSTVTTDAIMTLITSGADRPVYIAELQDAAQFHFDVDLERHDGATWEELQRWVMDEGRPVIILGHYGSLRTRMDRNYIAGHYVVVVGFDRVRYQDEIVERAIIHDPDYYGGLHAQGAFIPLVEDHLMSFWDDCDQDRNPRCMALVPGGE